MRYRIFIGAVAIAGASIGAASSSTVAVATEDVDTVVLDGSRNPGVGLKSTLVLTLDDPAPASQVERDAIETFGNVEEMSESRGTLRLSAPPLGSANQLRFVSTTHRTPGYYPIYCDSSYSFADANGRFSIQRQCGSRLVPWGYRLSAEVQSICVDYTVNERGLDW